MLDLGVGDAQGAVERACHNLSLVLQRPGVLCWHFGGGCTSWEREMGRGMAFLVTGHPTR